MAERLAAEEFGGAIGLTLGKSYFESKYAATLAMSITRINNAVFPVPNYQAEMSKDEKTQLAWKADWDNKAELLGIILQMPSHLVDTLSIVHAGLNKVDVSSEAARKKYSTP